MVPRQMKMSSQRDIYHWFDAYQSSSKMLLVRTLGIYVTTNLTFVLRHDPSIRHGALHGFGHVHGNWRGSRGCVSIGVVVWDFRPVTLFDIRKRSQELPVNPLLEQLEPGVCRGM